MFWLLLVILGIVLWTFRKKVEAVLVFIFFLTNGFQLVPTILFDTGIGIQKGSDFALIMLIMFIVANFWDHVHRLKHDTIARWIIVFTIFIVIAIGYATLYVGYDFVSVLRSARRFLFVLAYFPIRNLEYTDVERIFRIMLYITVGQAILYFMQAFLDVNILSRKTTDVEDLSELRDYGGWKRMYNIPEFTLFYLLYALFEEKLPKWQRFVSVTLFSAVILATLHRSYISAFIIALAIIGMFRSKGLLNRIGILGLVSTIIIIPLFSSVLSQRIDDGFNDLKNTFSGGYESDTFEDNFSFRLAHSIERYEYVTNDPIKIIFGLSFITEEIAAENNVSFRVGYKNKKESININTSDIAWSLLFVWIGIAGTVLFLLLNIRYIMAVWRLRESTFSTGLITFLLINLIISFTSTIIIDPTTITVTTFGIALCYLQKESQEFSYNETLNSLLASMPYRRRLVI